MNNWFSIEFFDNNGNYIEDYFFDSVYSSISEGLEDFKYQIKNNLKDIIKYFKGDDENE